MCRLPIIAEMPQKYAFSHDLFIRTNHMKALNVRVTTIRVLPLALLVIAGICNVDRVYIRCIGHSGEGVLTTN